MCYYYEDGLFWFRIFDYGLHFKNIKKHSLIFSERNNFESNIRFGNWLIKPLSSTGYKDDVFFQIWDNPSWKNISISAKKYKDKRRFIIRVARVLFCWQWKCNNNT